MLNRVHFLVGAEACLQNSRECRIALDHAHARARQGELAGDHARSSTDLDNEVARADNGVRHKAAASCLLRRKC